MKEHSDSEKNRDRLYEIYEIPEVERKEYTIHHIVFKADRHKAEFQGYNIDQISNLCPLPLKEHRRLHDIIWKQKHK